ncbi:uncharacterized protein LOC127006727 [Eriocheir sinensis]|uniref:uncharacterized protein LOC127006727 n=1 Tax=Eriocheir sinensis TaxID=95602 RepID=UPI0021C71CBE|nr:uncharacterized protein LOC127006727 [Eriocheir sinensis]
MAKAVVWVRVAMVLLAGLIASCSALEMGPKKEIPDDALFQDRAAFCEGCYAMVHEVEKLMTLWQKEKGSVEDHIDTALHAACSTDRLRTYVLSPPKMMRLCSGIRAHYMDEIGLAILRHYTRKETRSVDHLFQDICRKAIPACPKGLTPMTVTRQESRKKAEEEKEKEANTPTAQQDAKEKSTPKKDGTKGKTAAEKKKDEL